ncbi:MAG: NAD(P)H-dependent oxidoreductase [Actinomycetota bacterium]|nr:NAD(P)H-dependent oxidoreductase [Actinomycetota bacterium]
MEPLTDDTLRIALVIGSVRSQRFADAIVPWLEARFAPLDWLKLDIIDLAEEHLDPRVLRGDSPISDRLHQADGFVVLTPEYNHSYPAALKHAIDTHYAEWSYKPVAFVSYGAGSGGIRAVEHLRGVFAEVYATTTRNGVPLVAPWSHLDEDGRFRPPAHAADALEATMSELRWWALTLRRGRRSLAVPA